MADEILDTQIQPAAAEPAPAATGTPAEQQPAAPDFENMDVAGYEAAKRQFLDGSSGEKSVPHLFDDKSESEPEAIEAVSAAAEPTTPAEPVPEAEPEPEVDPIGKEYRPRLGKLPKVQQEAIQLVREMAEGGTTINLAEAERRVMAKYGVENPAPSGNATQAAAPARSSADVQASIEAMEAELMESAAEVDLARHAKLTIELRKAGVELQQARQAEHAATQAQEAEFQEIRTSTRRDYPQLRDAKSELSVTFNQVLDELETQGSPILNGSEGRVMRAVAEIAAGRLGIKPAGPGTPAPVTGAAPAATAPNIPAARRPPVMPASGAQRTATPANLGAQIQQRIDSVKTMDDYEKLKNELLAS